MPKTKSKSKSRTDNVIKLLILGDSNIGKSCLMIRYFENEFISCYITTIGVDFKKKDIVLDKKKFTLYVWDTAGNPRFRTITMNYIKGCNLFLLCFDTTDILSFNGLDDWIKTIQSYGGDINKIIIVGTKIDDTVNREVKLEDALIFCSKYNINYYEISGKSGENVESMFDEAVQLAYAPIKEKVKDTCSFLKGCNIM
jgi:Ras-related protein Rab-8A